MLSYFHLFINTHTLTLLPALQRTFDKDIKYGALIHTPVTTGDLNMYQHFIKESILSFKFKTSLLMYSVGALRVP